jgi:hypothetical protein
LYQDNRKNVLKASQELAGPHPLQTQVLTHFKDVALRREFWGTLLAVLPREVFPLIQPFEHLAATIAWSKWVQLLL